jgi:hypothetical protein
MVKKLTAIVKPPKDGYYNGWHSHHADVLYKLLGTASTDFLLERVNEESSGKFSTITPEDRDILILIIEKTKN